MAETVALNRKARHNYTISDTFEAGLVLTGTEIKSVRAGKANLSDAYARVERGEAWLVGAHIAPFEQGNRYNHEPRRDRKLLLHRTQIDQLMGRAAARKGSRSCRCGCTSTIAAAPSWSSAWEGQAAPRPPARHRRSPVEPRRRSASSPTPPAAAANRFRIDPMYAEPSRGVANSCQLNERICTGRARVIGSRALCRAARPRLIGRPSFTLRIHAR